MNRKAKVILHPAQLDALSVFDAIYKRKIGRLKLDNSFIHANKEVLEQRLNEYYYGDGYNAGRIMAIIGLILAVALLFIKDSIMGITIPPIYLTIPGLTFSFGLVGLIYGLLKANKKLKDTIRVIQLQWKTTELPTRDIIDEC